MDQQPRCDKHGRKKPLLVCPSCIAVERGKMGGMKRAQNMRKKPDDPRYHKALHVGRPRKEVQLTPPQSVMTPLNDS